jgi:hypothetical protein
MIEVFTMCGNLPKDYKYTVGERLKNALMDLMMNIYEANIVVDKTETLTKCRRHVVETKLYLRMLHDTNHLSVKRFAALSENIEAISKQVKAWSKANASLTDNGQTTNDN